MYFVVQTINHSASIAVAVQNMKEKVIMPKSMREYDLNVFYAEQYDEDQGTYWDPVFTIQPSVYQYDEETDSVTRQYMESFKLSLLETRALAPDFPEEEYGSDFFISLDYFKNKAKTIPGRVNQILSTLPPVDEIRFQEPETKWLDVLFV
jgi:hypothetical protein